MEFTECQASLLPVLGLVATRRMHVSSTSAQGGLFSQQNRLLESKISVSKPTNLAKPLLCLRSCLRSSRAFRPEPHGATNKPTERNKDLSVIVLIKPAASGFKNLLHTAANQFFCLHQQTRPVLVEVLPARNLGVHLSVPLHQPPSHLIQNRKPFNRKDPARCGHRRLWPLLHAGLSSAT